MRKFLLLFGIVAFVFAPATRIWAQNNQRVNNGQSTTAVNFPVGGCVYNWVNDNPSIGLAASGTGDIASFTAINTGNSAVTADITVTPFSPRFAYIANCYSNNVSVINTTTNTVTATIAVGIEPVAASVTPDGKFVYVANYTTDDVSVISTTTNTVIATVPVEGSPMSVTVSPDGKLAYVANETSNDVSVISTASNKVVSTLTTGVNLTDDLALSPDGSILYVISSSYNYLQAIYIATGKVITSVNVGSNPKAIAVSLDGSKVYVSNNDDNSVSVISTSTYTVTATIQVGLAPYGLVTSIDGSKLYVANSADGTVSVINTATNAISATIKVGTDPNGLSVNQDDSQLFVANYGSNSVSVINTATGALSATVNVGTNPISLGNFSFAGASCAASPTQFTITVLPGTALPAIIAGTVTGNISACVGTPSASPNLQQFTVSGSNLTANITASAPAGFEVSLSAGSGYAKAISFNLPAAINGVPGTVNIYVRSAAAAAAGNLSGNVILSSLGVTAQPVAVSAIINALPVVNPVADQTVTSGTLTTAVNFSGTGNIFNWSNDTPGIGLPASGTGNIPAFTAMNSGNAPVTAKITVSGVNKQGEFEYITDETASQVSVISNLTNSIVATIDVGAGPYGIALSPDGSTAYVSNYDDGSVSVINTAGNKVVATIPIGYSPIGIAVSSDGSRVYVCGDFGLYVIDASTNQVISSVLLSNYEPAGLTTSPDGKWIYVADPNNNSLLIINASTLQQTRISFPTNIEDSAFNVVTSPDGSLIYVTGADADNIVVISAVTQAIIKTINVPVPPIGIAISPDGNRLYVSNEFSNTVSVVNAADGTLISTVAVGESPEGIAVSPDGSTVYVANIASGTMSVISTATNQVSATIAAGSTPHALGNFIRSTISCSGPALTFSITVKPAPATITTGTVTGQISACQGSPSADPGLQQFSVTGSQLTSPITATAPAGFEVSLSAGSGYANSLNFNLPAGINGAPGISTLYVRSAASAPAGNLSGQVVLSSAGAANQNVSVTGIVNALPTVNAPSNQTIATGSASANINFTGTAGLFTWTNDSPGIGLAASGSGNIASFTAVNTGSVPVIATISVIPQSAAGGSGCSGTPVTFTITVEPTPPPSITTAAGLAPLTTVYGTPSTAESFTVSGANLVSGVVITPPPGFEISTDGASFSGAATIAAAGALAATPVYIRLAQTTVVGAYAGDIGLTTGTTKITLYMPNSTVTPAPLTITAHNKSKPFNSENPVLTFTYSGFVNNDNAAALASQPLISTTATKSSAIGQYPIVVSDAASPNYSFTYIQGILTVLPAGVVIPNTFTPNGDHINDTWVIKFIEYYPKCTVTIFSRWGGRLFSSVGYGLPWDGRFKGADLPSGTYYYLIDLKNGLPVLSGWVALIR